jgi:hypothetical protein
MIYHITHIDNLAKILVDDMLLSDAEMIRRGGPATAIGLSEIKDARLRLRVTCHPEGFVGDYVPFYFCPRSVMLYMFYMNNDPRLTYRGGQDPIVHLEADLREVVAWVDAERRRWAFSLSNAGARYAEFRSDLADLDEIDWRAVGANDWRDRDVREAKQAEFLVHHTFPWHLVRRIGVRAHAFKEQVEAMLGDGVTIPTTEVLPDWYYGTGR